MGSGVSVVLQQSKKDLNVGSSELQKCKKCNSDFEKLSKCKQCQQTLCSVCCDHSTEDTNVESQQRERAKEIENSFFGSNLSAKETHTLMIQSSKASQQTIRCATVVRNGKLAFLSQLQYGYKTSFKWKLCYLHDKPKYVTKRKHMDDNNIIFPGDICYIERKRTLYLTLPCERMVYKLPDGEDFHNAFQSPLGSCFGITSFGNGLALSIEIPKRFREISKWQIQYVDFEGNVKRRIESDSSGVALFSEPLYLASSFNGDILFVSDNGNNSVMSFDTNGGLLFRFDKLAVTKLRGLTADVYNNVYVACGKKVIQIKAGGGDIKKILEVNDNDEIVSVCIDKNTHALLTISAWGKVSSFEFEMRKTVEK